MKFVVMYSKFVTCCEQQRAESQPSKLSQTKLHSDTFQADRDTLQHNRIKDQRRKTPVQIISEKWIPGEFHLEITQEAKYDRYNSSKCKQTYHTPIHQEHRWNDGKALATAQYNGSLQAGKHLAEDTIKTKGKIRSNEEEQCHIQDPMQGLRQTVYRTNRKEALHQNT
ncbi:hypothetical protein CSKR_200360 [Clonorchis sinensis]|uniref:Uncharacterized protein n=1 Tax=Clonorchis sinensis TaxID=79923 RepID=A0A8T1MC87_CLOSI|nr:hypothetical protein CSKR_200360 [Clonorchis sinensis]